MGSCDLFTNRDCILLMTSTKRTCYPAKSRVIAQAAEAASNEASRVFAAGGESPSSVRLEGSFFLGAEMGGGGWGGGK